MDQERVAVFQRHLAQLAQERGLELTPDLMNEVFAESAANGLTAGSTIAALDDVTTSDSFDSEVDDLGTAYAEEDGDSAQRDLLTELVESHTGEAASKIGRPLTRREQDALKAEATRQAEQFGRLDSDTVVRESGIKGWGELSHLEQARLMAERCEDANPDPRWSEDREFDMDVRRDRDDYHYLRATGHEFEDTDG